MFNFTYSRTLEYQYQRYWSKIRDCLGGEDIVKLKRELYLPKPSGQNEMEYLSYLNRACFYGISERTLRSLTGLIMRNDPVFILPNKIKEGLNSITNKGDDIYVLLEEIFSEVLSIGRYGILVDYTDKARLVSYYAEDILEWDMGIDSDGNRVLNRILLREDYDNDTSYTLEYIRDHDNGAIVANYYKSDNNGSYLQDQVTPKARGYPLRTIPFIFINSSNLSSEVSKPPFLDLVNMNLAHYRNSADLEHALYLTAQPTPWLSGAINEKDLPEKIGSGTIWVLPQDSTVGMLEFKGQGVAAQRQAMLDKEARMAVLGARMINDELLRQESYSTARLRHHSETSLLQSVVNMTESALNKLFNIITEWEGISGEDIEISLNREFIEARLSGNDLLALAKSFQDGIISRETLHWNLQRGDIVKSTTTVNDEVRMIEEDRLNKVDTSSTTISK